jgi:LPS-assembly lipoprotein
MLSSRICALFLVFTLVGCGFEPMLAQNTKGAQEIATVTPNIDIPSIPDRDGQYLRNLLMDQLYTAGRPADASYELKFSPLVKEIVKLGVRKDATSTRAQMQIMTRMQLVEKKSGTVLLERSLKTVGAYNLLDNQLATMVSQQNITESILQEMKDDAVTELNLYFRRRAAAS